MAVRLIVRIVRFVLSATAFVSLCLEIVSLRVIPLCYSSFASFSFQNSPPQSARICETWCVVAFSTAFMVLIKASVGLLFECKGVVTIYRL